MFSEEEMRSDPEYAPPKITMTEVKDDAPQEKTSVSQSWFDSNKYARVPVIALESDPVQLPNQNYVCFSVIKPEDYRAMHYEKDSQKNSYNGFLIKFRGVFKSKEEADKHIKRIMALDKHFDVHLVPCFQWTGIDEEFVSDTEYANNVISDIMKGYFQRENDRFMSMRDRIALTEKPDVVRSEEATEFFQQSAEKRPMIEELPEDVSTVTLDELASATNIEPKTKVVNVDTKLSDSSKESIIAEVLLE